MHSREPTVLLIGGADSSGGAGIARDVHVCTEHSVRSALAITAVTAQTDTGVHAIHHIPAAVVAAQMRAALESSAVRAIKIGMLGCRDSVEAIVESLPNAVDVPVILDPVLVSSSGHALLDAAGLEALRARLLPRAHLVTPNIPEAATLLDRPPGRDASEAIEHAHALRRLGVANVLVKGGHAPGANATDVLLAATGLHTLAAPRVAATLRGTGCMLATAIGARLATGSDLIEACRAAKHYVFRQLAAAESTDARASTLHRARSSPDNV